MGIYGVEELGELVFRAYGRICTAGCSAEMLVIDAIRVPSVLCV
jgi:hypothetical protein